MLRALRDATSLARDVPGVAFLEFATEETSISIGPGSDPQPSDVVDNRLTRNATSCHCNADSVNLFRSKSRLRMIPTSAHGHSALHTSSDRVLFC